jgi:hypothetical protein
LVKVVNTTKSLRPTGGAIGRFYGGAYAISTREKREKERAERLVRSPMSQFCCFWASFGKIVTLENTIIPQYG